jgi:hypothetical protein
MRRWWIVDQVPGRANVAEVAACTVTAAHGRDHHHGLSEQCCHPHAVQVVYLGHRALTVCHDCRTDSGFLPYREAERLADGHRDQTRGASVSLTLAVAS